MNIFDKKLSIVMPAYNEGANIYNNLMTTVREVNEFHNNFEIIVVNDGSKDNTKEEIKRASEDDEHIIAVSYTPNMGKGKAIKEGTMQAVGDYIAFLDADLDLSPMHLKSFLKKMEETGVEAVIGSKLHKDSEVDYPKRRKLMSVGYYVILVVLFHLPVKDTQTGVKLFKGSSLKQIIERVQSKGFAYDIEILANIVKNGGKIAEMPIELKFQRENRWGRIRMKDIWEVVQDTLKVFRAVHRK